MFYNQSKYAVYTWKHGSSSFLSVALFEVSLFANPEVQGKKKVEKKQTDFKKWTNHDLPLHSCNFFLGKIKTEVSLAYADKTHEERNPW